MKLFGVCGVYTRMKTLLCVVSLIASLGVARAHDTGCAPNAAYYQASAAAYLTPVVYQALAVYQGPVAYYAPVYYVTPPASFGYPSKYERACPPRSTVVCIGSGGVYSYSNCGYPGSTLVIIGSRYARRD
jgi:hypothetical protein